MTVHGVSHVGLKPSYTRGDLQETLAANSFLCYLEVELDSPLLSSAGPHHGSPESPPFATQVSAASGGSYLGGRLTANCGWRRRVSVCVPGPAAEAEPGG